MRFPWLVCALLVALPSRAAEKPKTRTLKELIDLAMQKGKEEIIPKEVTEDLGFAEAVKVKRIAHEFKNTEGTGIEHAFNVAYHETTENRDKTLIALIVGVVEVSKKKEKKYYDIWTIRSNLNGIIEHAAHASGQSGHVEQKPVVINSSKIKKLFRKELDSFLSDPLSQEPKK